jgi:hypothetical protein
MIFVVDDISVALLKIKLNYTISALTLSIIKILFEISYRKVTKQYTYNVKAYI